MDDNAAPCVSICVPLFNEERDVGECLESLLALDYPRDRLEILVLDGGSTDRTRETVAKLSAANPTIRLVENPKRIQAAAMNVGLREARGEIVLRVDAHARCEPDYARECVRLLESSGAANVGGVQLAEGVGYFAAAAAIAITRPFGIGNARHRYSGAEESVDTVYLGAWRKRMLEEAGGFDESFRVNEDYELNYRLRRAGGTILLSPRIRCRYYGRRSPLSLAKQFFRYGMWRVKTIRTHPRSVRGRHLVPPFFVLGLALSLGWLPAFGPAALAFPALYAAANLASSLRAAAKRGLRYLPALSLAFTIVHLMWGLCFWVGVLRFGFVRPKAAGAASTVPVGATNRLPDPP
jgi:glycosyltransferase involved in cell wall biosynthesis